MNIKLFDIQLFSSWDSVLSLILSMVSLWMVGSVRRAILRHKRKTRIESLIQDVIKIPSDAVPLASASMRKIEALERNVRGPWYKRLFGIKSEISKAIKSIANKTNLISEADMDSLKELIADWQSHSEDM